MPQPLLPETEESESLRFEKSSAASYAQSLTLRLAIREGRSRKAEALLILSDDVAFHGNFRALVEELEVPDDWEILLFGCEHVLKPEIVGRGLVRPNQTKAVAGVAIRSGCYRKLQRALKVHQGPSQDGSTALERSITALASQIPTYACFPNLAWVNLDLSKDAHPPFGLDGTQSTHPEIVSELFTQVVGETVSTVSQLQPKVGLLFLTRGDVNHPEIWREFVNFNPDRVAIFSHPKHPEKLAGGFLDNTCIAESHETAWGTISLVKATLSLLKAALCDSEITHFVLLSESCVPILPLSQMLRHLKYDTRSRLLWKEIDECGYTLRSRTSRLPGVPLSCWLFHSQWWMLDRIAARWVTNFDYSDVFAGVPIPDECFFATTLSLLGYPVRDRAEKRPITWTLWKKGFGSPESHSKVSNTLVESMLTSGAWFARKFPMDSDIARWKLHLD